MPANALGGQKQKTIARMACSYRRTWRESYLPSSPLLATVGRLVIRRTPATASGRFDAQTVSRLDLDTRFSRYLFIIQQVDAV